jgi:hypothetical protein
MLSKLTTLTLLGFAAVQADSFLSAVPKNFEIYTPLQANEAGVKTLKDLQFKCQYMAGLNFYNLQALALK